MKTRLTIVVTILLSIVIMGFENNFIGQDKEFEIKAIYTGVTFEDQFEFLNDEDEYIYFDSIKSNIKIDLYDDENIDKEFLITWIEEKIEISNESETSQSETRILKIITLIKEI